MAQDVSKLITPGLVNTVKNTDPKNFGPQIKKAAVVAGTAFVVNAVLSNPLVRLERKKFGLIIDRTKLDINHRLKLLQLDFKHTPKKQAINGNVVDIPAELDDEKYNKAVANENSNYQIAVALNTREQEKVQKDIDDYLKDPFKKQREAREKRKAKRKKAKSRTKEEKRKARRAKLKAVYRNAKKILAPILVLYLTEEISKVIAQNDSIRKLVNDTNEIITTANLSNDTVQLNDAKVKRDTAIKIINDNEQKIFDVQQKIAEISLYIAIFEVILAILSAIPIPVSVPPGIGLPVNVITKIIALLQRADKLITALSAIIPAVLICLERAIMILEEYKSQLLDINGQIDDAAASNPNLPSLMDINKFGDYDKEYKGFRFAIKQDNDPKYVIAGNHRHYAVAYDAANVPVLRSEYSYTLNPDDLIEQLKIKIDQTSL
jgi:hypothetical protein